MTKWGEVRPGVEDGEVSDVQVGEVVELPSSVGLHRHRWSRWGEVFSSTSGGIVGVFSGGVSGPWWQGRNCVRCGKAQRRRVEIKGDR